MRLKRVRIFGFKTFADRAEFSLEGGIIAVVGPNGCGKSNLVDAILWGLGEGNSRHLRAQTSQDVIFGGSAKRKPVGFAEVSLLFDNEDGSLPIDSAEVTVTRRLNRAGESEYFINRRPCRQRDIHDLLADSGLGRAGYSIVGQKEIDQALAASAEDRRAWVDEAAGVQRYRAKKQESVKRLASAKDHLSRVDDILHELDQQREPLRQEAEIAKKYRAATTALQEIETGLLIQELSRAITDLEEVESKLVSCAQNTTQEADHLTAIEARAAQIQSRLAAQEEEIQQAREGLHALNKAAERAGADMRLAEEKRRSLDHLEATLLEEVGDAAIADAQAELDAAVTEAEQTAASLMKARESIGGMSAEAAELRKALGTADQELVGARRAQSLRDKQLAEQEHRQERIASATRELEGVRKSLPSLEQAEEDARSTLSVARDKFKAAEGILADQSSKLSALQAEQAEFAAKERKLLSEQAALEGRHRGIEATLHANEGLAQGARAVVDAARIGHLSASYIPVGEAIETEKEHALALETALGAAANDLIVERENDAKAAIQYLKENRLGRATFQPLPLMRNSDVSNELKRLVTQPGVVGRAADLVRCQPEYRSVVESLLGRVLIVDDLDSSLRLAKSHGWSRMITLDGEVVHSSGAVTGGVQSKQHYGLVQRRSDLKQIERELAILAKQISEQELVRQVLSDKAITIENSTQAARAEIEKASEEAREAKQYHHVLLNELETTRKAGERIEAELEKLSSTIEVGKGGDIERLQSERDQIMERLAAKSADANQAKEAVERAETAQRQARARREAAERRLQTLQQREQSRSRRIASLEPERKKVQALVASLVSEKAHLEDRSSHAQKHLADALGEREGFAGELHSLSDQAQQTRANLAALAAASHQAELARARADAKRASAEERLLEEYGISAEDAIEQAPRIEVPADAAPLASKLRREIKAMGVVNVGAIEAFDRLTSRHEELTQQRGDVLEGVEQVQGSMRALDQLTRERFVDTFTKVEQAYAEIFQRLFGGGEGKIYLDNPANILESGIEIEVTLPGKKRQRLELLSGGERALCASGFLFALLQTKPSPLVVLDEVDAPLDGRNVERFADVLVTFTDRCQFIVITHNPTTIERAPIWLGVTMQEPGVSTLVPARMPVAV